MDGAFLLVLARDASRCPPVLATLPWFFGRARLRPRELFSQAPPCNVADARILPCSGERDHARSVADNAGVTSCPRLSVWNPLLGNRGQGTIPVDPGTTHAHWAARRGNGVQRRRPLDALPRPAMTCRRSGSTWRRTTIVYAVQACARIPVDVPIGRNRALGPRAGWIASASGKAPSRSSRAGGSPGSSRE